MTAQTDRGPETRPRSAQPTGSHRGPETRLRCDLGVDDAVAALRDLAHTHREAMRMVRRENHDGTLIALHEVPTGTCRECTRAPWPCCYDIDEQEECDSPHVGNPVPWPCHTRTAADAALHHLDSDQEGHLTDATAVQVPARQG